MGKGKASTAAAAKAATSNSKKAVVAKKKKTPSVKAPPPSSSSRKGSGRQQHKQGALDSVFGPLVSKNKNSNKKQHQAPSRPRSNSRSDRSNSGSNSRRNGRGPQDNRDEPITYRPNYNNNNAVEGGVVKKKHSKQKNTKRDGGDTNNTQSDFKRQKRHSAPPAPPPSSVKLPTKPAPPASTVPWMMQSSQKTAAATPTATEKRRNTTSTPDAAAAAAAPYCCPAILTALDDELERFGVYVMLNDTECQARRNLVEQFEQTARELFAAKQRQQQQLRSSNNNNNSQHTRFLFSGGSAARTTSTTTPANKMAASLSSSSSSSNKTKKIECKVFGSFATLAVCTFQSDVDLALWGVVPVTAAVEPCSIPSRGAQRNNTNKAPNNTAATMTTEGLAIGEPGAKKMSKQELLRLKWKDALAATDDANANCATDERSGLQSSSEEVDDTKTSAALAAALSAANAVTSAKAEPATVTVTVEEEACSSIPEGERNNADEALLLFVIDRVGDPSLAAEAAVDASETLCITTSSDNALDGDAAAAATAPNSTARTDGCSKDTAIEVDYEKDANSVNPADSTDDDDDDADPMESFPTMQNRIHSALSAKRSYAVMNTASAKDDDDGYVTAESSDTDDESVFDEEGSASSDLEVSFFSGQPAMPPTNAPAGPQGWVRTEVVSALASFSNKLRKSKLTKTVYLIKGARVPIIKVDTFFGFEADIAVGGHNGTDTSSYAATQVEMYQSFSSVVLFLKVLLSQQSLDTPFTGGLGSYKLYVLVADHLQRHLALGRSDRPGEVLLSFLYRYGCCGANRNDATTHQTKLSQHRPVEARDGASADLSNVYKLNDCVHLFRLCWERLWERVRDSKQARREVRSLKLKNSLLAIVVCPERLRRDREASLRQLNQSLGRLNTVINPQTQPAPPVVAQRTSTTAPPKKPPIDPRQRAPSNLRDRTLEEIVAGYGVDVEGLTFM